MAQRKVAIEDARKLGDCFPGDIVLIRDDTWRLFSLGDTRGFVRTYDTETKRYGECQIFRAAEPCKIIVAFMPTAAPLGGDPDPLLRL